MLDLEKIYFLNEKMVLHNINDKFWCLDTENGTQYRLNRVSYDILSEIKKQQKISVAISEASKKYNVSAEIFFKDAVAMLNLALDKNIIKKGE